MAAAAWPGAGAGDSDLLIAVEFRGMSEWQDISRKLAATPGVEELEVAGLSARGARVTLRYAEGAERLADALARAGPEPAQRGRQLGALGCNRGLDGRAARGLSSGS